MSAMKERPGAKGFIISGRIENINFDKNDLSTRISSVHARHLRVSGAHREAGRRDPHQLAPLHARGADSERIQGEAALFIDEEITRRG